MNTIDERVVMLIASVLGTDVSGMLTSMPRTRVAEWNSLKHIEVILALEEEFSVEFSDLEIANAMCIDELINLIAGKIRK